MTVAIDAQPAAKAIKTEVSKASLTLTASGSSTWDSGEGSVGRSFSITVSK